MIGHGNRRHIYEKYLFAFFWACLVIAGYAQEQKGTVYGVAFYNLENLFDTKHDEGKKDYEYLPDGRNKWDDKKYQSKLKICRRYLDRWLPTRHLRGLR